VGLVAIGGVAAGLVALGGAAFGLAAAREVALGGAAMGAHANDGVAREFFQQRPARLALSVLKQARWLGLLVVIPIIVGLRSAREAPPPSRNRAT
jgi:hypothetical protein